MSILTAIRPKLPKQVLLFTSLWEEELRLQERGLYQMSCREMKYWDFLRRNANGDKVEVLDPFEGTVNVRMIDLN